MSFNLAPHQLPDLTDARIFAEIRRHEAESARRALLWSYYRNELVYHAGSARPMRLAQERGLPERLTRSLDVPAGSPLGGPREIVIENDIAWRIGTMIDFLFGKPLTLRSTAADPALAERIEQVLGAVWRQSGGMGLLHDLAVLGHVYGGVQLLLDTTGQEAIEAISDLRIRLVPPQRAAPLMQADDYRQLEALLILYEPDDEARGLASDSQIAVGASPTNSKSIGNRVLRALAERFAFSTVLGPAWAAGVPLAPGSIVQVASARLTQWYRVDDNGQISLIHQRDPLCPGVLPAVHIQNVAVPLAAQGSSEVEPLIPLQNELNTRLSDRANRVTMQCFKMYLAKGIDGFDKAPVMPGTIWHTDNPLASIEAFGGDAASPSEESHIGEVREAMDKLSATPPLAAGVVRSKIGNLTSENALKVTLQGILSRTQRKRLTYGRGIIDISRAALAALDHAGLLRTTPQQRSLELVWAEALPGGVQPAPQSGVGQSTAAQGPAIDPSLITAEPRRGVLIE